MAAEPDHDPPEVTSIAEASSYLYGLEPGSFVASRTAVVKSLRKTGDRALADEVKALRRPSLIAAELNRLTRSAPEQVDRLLAEAEALRSGHRAMLAGEPVDLAGLQRDHREAARQLAAQSEREEERLAAILEAASLDEACHRELQAGTFAVEPTPASGFDLFQGAAVAKRSASVSSLAGARRRRARRSATGAPPDDTPDRKPDGEQPHESDEPTGSGHQPEPASTETAKRTRPPTKRSGARKRRPTAVPTETVEQAQAALRQAERRVEAATKKRRRAADRVDELQRRLTDAEANLVETEQAVAAATKALEAAEARVAEAQRNARRRRRPPRSS